MYRSRYAPGNDSTETDEAFARSLHEAELRGIDPGYWTRQRPLYYEVLRRFAERGRRTGEPSSLEGPRTAPTLAPGSLRHINDPTNPNAWILDRLLRLRAEQELQAAVDAARAYREAQAARDAHLAALYDALEREREAQIVDDRAIALALQEDTSLDEDRPSSTQRRTATRLQPPAPAPTFDCAVCFNPYPVSDLIRLPCDHHYCPECLSTLIDGAVTASISRLNPQPFPPSCCPGHPIPYRSVIHFLTAQTRSNIIRYQVLLLTPIEERIWCAQPDCGRFIPPTNHANTNGNNGNQPTNADLMRCRTCQQHTCAQCKRLDLDHMGGAGGVCPEDADVKALLATAQQRGWQQCFRCRSMVEKTDGCNHMTCNCGAQFCYVCGTRWQGRRCDHGF